MIVINPEMLKEFSGPGRCEWCWNYCHRREPHHYRRRGIGSGSRIDLALNLVSLCPSCHRDCHSGKIGNDQILAVIAARENLAPQEVSAKIDELLRTQK